MGASVVAGGHAAPILQLGEHVFNAMSLTVELCVVGDLDLSVPAWRDAGRNALSP